jgi:hypothetical protein
VQYPWEEVHHHETPRDSDFLRRHSYQCETEIGPKRVHHHSSQTSADRIRHALVEKCHAASRITRNRLQESPRPIDTSSR